MNTRGGVEAQLHGFVTLPLDGVLSAQLNAPAALSSEGEEKTERPRTGNHASKTTEAGATKVCTLAPKSCGPSVWNVLYITPQNFEAAPRFVENSCTPIQQCWCCRCFWRQRYCHCGNIHTQVG